VYRADFSWNHKQFDMKGFYRTGHYHWGYEGDFFGLYPEANYGPNIDIYNGAAPSGVEFTGKRSLSGFSLAMGPELWWGANPAILLKYTESSFAIPQPKTRRATIYQTFTGWRLKDSGSGNQYNILSGFTYSIGNLQIGPNFLWQRPIEGPIPSGVDAPGRPRNILNDPFAVRSNREMTAGEILFTFDPTPGTWMYQWDNDRAEDAKFALSTGFVFRHLPTSQDAAIGILPDGRTFFPFPGAAPAADLWEAHARIVSRLSPDFGLVANIYGGTAQANGSDQREIERFGADVRTIYKHLKITAGVKINDWGPYDYHRDFNLTYPSQLILDINTSLGKPSWFDLPNTKIGIQGMYRLYRCSERFVRIYYP